MPFILLDDIHPRFVQDLSNNYKYYAEIVI